VKADLGDVRLFFDVEGAELVPLGAWMHQRPTVVLLHTGPGADHSLFKDTIGPPLAAVAQVIYLDHRGAGRSDRSTSEHWNLDTWADDVARFCSTLEITRPIVLGSAFGAFVAMRLAVRHPDLVRGLVLVSAVARHVPGRSIALMDRLGGPHAGEVAARYYADSSEENLGEYMRVCVPLFTRVRATADLLARMVVNLELAAHWDGGGSQTVDLREEARQIGCPTVVLAGEDDPAYTLSGTEELMQYLPAERARLHVFEDARYGVFRDAPQAVDVVLDFVLSLEQS
jgi:pimeloyl-ACP methyl ester carboxylesterase